MKVQDGNEVTVKLAAKGLGKSFVAKAVCRLSSSIHLDDQVAGMMNVRVCESARMNPFRDAIAGGCSNDTVIFTETK